MPLLRWGKGGATSDWPCMWREGALGPAINIVASLCADVRFFGSALRMGAALAAGHGAAGFLFLLGTLLTGVVHWSVLESLAASGVWCSLTQLRGGRGRCIRVMGAACSAACPQRRCNHLPQNYDGVVGGAFRCGFSERRRAGEDTLWGVLSLVGGGTG
jgi:hypothetical protein